MHFFTAEKYGTWVGIFRHCQKKIVFLFFIFVTNSFFWTSFGTFDTNLSKVTPLQSSWLHACRSYNGVLYYVVVLRCLSGSQKKGWRTDKVYRNDFEPYLMPAGNSKHCHLKMHLQPTKCHFPDVTVSRYRLQYLKKVSLFGFDYWAPAAKLINNLESLPYKKCFMYKKTSISSPMQFFQSTTNPNELFSYFFYRTTLQRALTRK